MDISTFPFLYLAIIGFAAVVHGAVGIGFPMVATPLLAMVTDVKTAVLILVVPTVLINAANIIKGGKWSQSIARYWPLALWGMTGSFIGTRLLIISPPEFFRPMLAAVIIFYLNARRLGLDFSWIQARPKQATAVFGIVAGLLGGTVNVMLPALVIFALEIKMEKTIMIQVFNLCFFLAKLIQGAVFISAGIYTSEALKASLPLAVLAVIIMITTMGIRDRIKAEAYEKGLRMLLGGMAGILIIQFFRNLVV